MTIAQVQPLNTLIASELTKALDFLYTSRPARDRRKVAFTQQR